MTAGYRVLSYEFRLGTGAPQVLGPVGEFLSRFEASDLNGVPTYRIGTAGRHGGLLEVFLDDDSIQRSADPESLVDFLVWHVSQQAIARAEEHLALHAGALSYRGAGIVLPAPPDSGKTTLTAALTRAGFDYLSDEAALIDPRDGMLYPFSRPLWMERGTIEKFPDLLARRPGPPRVHYPVLPDELRAGSVGAPCPVRFVVAPSYRPGVATHLEPISRAEAIVLLSDNCFNFERFGVRGVELLRDVVSGAGCYRLPMGDLGRAVDAIGSLVAS